MIMDVVFLMIMAIFLNIKQYPTLSLFDGAEVFTPSKEEDVWRAFYTEVFNLKLSYPLLDFDSKIDLCLGCSGWRYHPINEIIKALSF